VCRLNDVANPPKGSVTLHTRTKGTGDGCGIRWTRRFSGRQANTRGRCHHKLSYASTTPKTVCKPQSEPKTPWRARCFSGMRWNGCGTALQHPSNRSCVRFADARQHRGRAWYIEVSASKCVRVIEGKMTVPNEHVVLISEALPLRSLGLISILNRLDDLMRSSNSCARATRTRL
jgi:hypothetical protein